jgi:hypothetical protein
METTMKHSPHLDALEAQLRNIGENEGGEALRDAARDIFYALCSVIASTSGVAELARSVNSLPEALLRASVVKANELAADPIRTPRQLLN